MKIIAISDLHGNLPEITETADLLILGGDISPLNIQSNLLLMEGWLSNIFSDWINSIPVEQVIMIAGNHDYWFERYGEDDNKLYDCLYSPTQYKIKYLHNQKCIIYDENGNEISIFGTPYCGIYGNWPFMKSGDILKEKFNKIPEGIDILIAHSPAYGFCDIVENDRKKSHLGSVVLAERIHKVKPKLVLCGHIHTGNHNIEYCNGIEYVNISLLDEKYKIKYNHFIYEYISNI